MTFERPLLSYVLLTFNQDQYVQAALSSALAQTYQPMEIIISDDYSTDQTYPIICSLVSNYQGPHRIRVRKNDKNLGIGEHLNAVMQIASGKLIIMAAGDDVS